MQSDKILSELFIDVNVGYVAEFFKTNNIIVNPRAFRMIVEIIGKSSRALKVKKYASIL